MTTASDRDRTYVVVAQEWEESERGWGTRPDGFTLHLTMEDAEKYLSEFAENERRYNPSGVVPDEYTRACGAPRPVDVNADAYNKLVELRSQGKSAMAINRLTEVEPFSKTREREEKVRKEKEAKEALEQRRVEAIKTGLAKLTLEEKTALGLDRPAAAPVVRDVNRGWR